MMNKAADQSAPVKLVYRVNRYLIRLGTKITCGAAIEARELGKRRWMGVNIGGKALVYSDVATAERHCAWLNDPSGTEPEWGRDESPNAQRERPAEGGGR